MPNMPTVTEAQQAVDTLRRFVDGLSQLFAATTTTSATPQVKAGSPTATPKTWKDKVLAILTSSGGPMAPRDVTARYKAQGWPIPDGSKVGNLIRSTLAHLKKDGEVVVDGDGRYRLSGS